MKSKSKKTVVAFSGGLDTTYCAAWLRHTSDAEIITVTVDTGGFSASELEAIEARSHEAGAHEHVTLDGKNEVFDRIITTLIQGNVLKGQVYPLCVSAERVTQAGLLVEYAKNIGADAIAHGSTGAGNDQVRFDVAVRTLAPEMELITPIRDQALSRHEETAWLEKNNIHVPQKTSVYSVNAGMWGTTIGGAETHDPWKSVPDDAYENVVGIKDAPENGIEMIISFEKGIPVAVDSEKIDGPALVEKLNSTGAAHGVGRGVHLGDTILGIKGRIAFEAPAAAILISAHRELEKLVLSRWQQFWKDKIADFYGMLLHEALYYDPVVTDITAMIRSSQHRVTGDVRLKLLKGVITIQGVRSPHSVMNMHKAMYGESTGMWNGRDAEGFSLIHGMGPMLYAAASEEHAGGTS